MITAQARRSRYAPLVLLLLALLCTAGIYSVVATDSATATSGSSSANVQEGEALFEANCASCHGPDAAGTDIAPSLTGVGAASVHFQMITGRMPMANNSPQAEAKEPQFSEEQIEDVAAYVASLGPGPAIPSADMVDPALGDPASGMELFRTNCSMCHNAVGAGGALSEGKVAPSLMDSTPVEIYEAMVTGPQSMPVFNDANITPQGKRDIIAYIDYQQNAESVGGNNLGSIGPVVEGLWIWIIGIGGLCLVAVWIGAKKS
ncbi:cytochrome bc1 complex diheme cytochrome c subunit [Flaviflexus equikiangi]|uniref:cytochrome bc1 complex diheme cytochrome c subunit n=1 Tax=Flaviflexus equikiangi TaxID=2758573 RepID=UPI0021752A02|nr:c-type cytochrome [Flaviflexus equikiangi]